MQWNIYVKNFYLKHRIYTTQTHLNCGMNHSIFCYLVMHCESGGQQLEIKPPPLPWYYTMLLH